MPRSSGGRGISFSASSGSNNTKDAATLIGLSAANKNLAHIAGSHSCQIVFDAYDECMKEATRYGASRCDTDFYRKHMESCRGFKRDPGHRNIFDKLRDWKESVQGEATAAGFSSFEEYFWHKKDRDPAMCCTAYKLYKECLSEKRQRCDTYYRKNCPQFKTGS